MKNSNEANVIIHELKATINEFELQNDLLNEQLNESLNTIQFIKRENINLLKTQITNEKRIDVFFNQNQSHIEQNKLQMKSYNLLYDRFLIVHGEMKNIQQALNVSNERANSLQNELNILRGEIHNDQITIDSPAYQWRILFDKMNDENDFNDVENYSEQIIDICESLFGGELLTPEIEIQIEKKAQQIAMYMAMFTPTMKRKPRQ